MRRGIELPAGKQPLAKDRYGERDCGHHADAYVPGLAAGSADLARIGELTDFAAGHAPASAQNALEVAVARIRYHAALRARLGSLDDWLRSNAAR